MSDVPTALIPTAIIPASIIPAAAALAAVIGLVLLASRLVRATGLGRTPRFRREGDGSRLVIVDTLAIDRARRLHVVKWDGHDVMLLTGGPADVVVGWVPRGDRQ